MDNFELQQKFLQIAKINNSLDAIIALKDFKKEYKKSIFYKKTKMPIYKAYDSFIKMNSAAVLNKIKSYTDINNLIDDFNYIIDNIDEESISNILDRLSNVLKIDGLDKYNQLGALLNNLKK